MSSPTLNKSLSTTGEYCATLLSSGDCAKLWQIFLGIEVPTVCVCAGIAKALVLEPDRSKLGATLDDLSYVLTRVVDSEGQTVAEDQDVVVTFSITGPTDALDIVVRDLCGPLTPLQDKLCNLH